MRYTLIFLFILLLPQFTDAQTTREYIFRYDQVCAVHTILFLDGTYKIETGCHGYHAASFGTWKEKGDTIIFSNIEADNLDPIDTIISTGNKNDSIHVRILDRDGIDITQKVSMLLHIKGKARYPFDHQNTNPKTTMRMNGSMICIYTLERMFDRSFDIDPELGSDFTIKLSLPGKWLHNKYWGGQVVQTWIKDGENYKEISMSRIPVLYKWEEQIYKPIK